MSVNKGFKVSGYRFRVEVYSANLEAIFSGSGTGSSSRVCDCLLQLPTATFIERVLPAFSRCRRFSSRKP